MMTLEEKFPMRVCINLDRRPDRLVEVRREFAREGMHVERLAAVDALRVRNTRGRGVPAQYACQLSHQVVLRRARQARVPAVMVFEDDVGLCPGFREKVEGMRPPEDWGMIVFGCTHVHSPRVVDAQWVRVRYFWGTHAYAVRAEWLPVLLRELRKPAAKERLWGGVDNAMSRLSAVIPMYAPLPNWAWQRPSFSDLMGKDRAIYSEDGAQTRRTGVLRRVEGEMKSRRRRGDAAGGGVPSDR